MASSDTGAVQILDEWELVSNAVCPVVSFCPPCRHRSMPEVLDDASLQATQLGHHFIGVDDILLGLLVRATDLTPTLFCMLGVNWITVRHGVLDLLGARFKPADDPFAGESVISDAAWIRHVHFVEQETNKIHDEPNPNIRRRMMQMLRQRLKDSYDSE
jgi:hypothetical protein